MFPTDGKFSRVRKTILTRIGLISILAVAGYVFPLLYIVVAWLAWTIYEDLCKPDQTQPDAWLGRRQTVTLENADWKSVFMEVCESPAEASFLEAMIAEYSLVPEKGDLKGAGIALDLQAEIKPYRADFLADNWLVIEIDGAAYHSSAEAIKRDQERDRYLVAKGYTVLRVPAKLVFNAPSVAVGRVRSAIANRKLIERAEARLGEKQPTLLQLVAQVPKQVADLLDDVDQYVTQAKEIQKAAYSLDLQVYREKSLLESALNAAKEQMRLDIELDADPILKEHYLASLRMFDDTERDIELGLKSEAVGQDYQHPPAELPAFAYSMRHSDSNIADKVEYAIRAIKAGRDEFLDRTFEELNGDPKLMRYFERTVKDLGGEGYFRKLLSARGQ